MPSPSTRPRLSNRPPPGVASENAQLRTPGWPANRRAIASCIDAMRAIRVSSAPVAVLSRPLRGRDVDGRDQHAARLHRDARLLVDRAEHAIGHPGREQGADAQPHLGDDQRAGDPAEAEAAQAARRRLQGALGRRPGGPQRGQHAGEHRARDAQRERLHHDLGRHPQVHPERQIDAGRHALDDQVHAQQADTGREKGQDERLDEELSDDARPAGPERRPQRELARTVRGPREKQDRDVAARDQQQDERHALGDEEKRRQQAGRRPDAQGRERHRIGPNQPPIVRRRVVTDADGRQLRARLASRRPFLEAAVHPHRGTQAVGVVDGASPQGQPELLPTRHREARGHHAHDRRGDAADAEGGADDVGTGAEPGAPVVVSDHHDLGRPDDLVRGRQRASLRGRHSRQRERGRAHLRPARALRPTVVRDHVHLPEQRGPDEGERGEARPQRLVVAETQQLLRTRLLVAAHHADDLIALIEGRRLVEDGIEEMMGSQARRDADAEGEDHHQREPRMLHEHPDAELQVEPGDAEAAPRRRGERALSIVSEPESGEQRRDRLSHQPQAPGSPGAAVDLLRPVLEEVAEHLRPHLLGEEANRQPEQERGTIAGGHDEPSLASRPSHSASIAFRDSRRAGRACSSTTR